MRYRFSDCEFDSDLYSFKRTGQEIHLRPKVRTLLMYLIEHRQRFVSRDELCNEVWTGRCVSNTTVESTVKELRRLLGDNGDLQRIVRTQLGFGYRFIASLESCEALDEAALCGERPKKSPHDIPTISTEVGAGVRTGMAEPPENSFHRARHQVVVLEAAVIFQNRRRIVQHCATTDRVLQLLEELRDATVERFEGHLAQQSSTRFWIHYSYPYAQEDAASRAVLTAFELVDVANSLTRRLLTGSDIRMYLSIFIDAGFPVGEMSTAAIADRPDTFGENQSRSSTYSTSAHTVEVSESIYRRIATAALVVDEQPSRGAQRRYRIEKATTPGNHGDGFLLQTGIPLVHRATELALLEQRWQCALSGSGQICLVSGQAGIGKSRLARAIFDSVTGRGHRHLVIQSLAIHCSSPFYSITTLLHRILGFREQDDGATRRRKLRLALHRRALGLDHLFETLAAFLSIDIPALQSAGAVQSAQSRKDDVIEALSEWLVMESRWRSIIVIWEDLHWTDASSLQLIHRIIDRVPASGLFVVLTCRSEFGLKLPERSYIAPIVLDRLTSTQTREFIDSLLHGRAIGQAQLDEIIERTDGIPLFVEQCLAMLLEQDDGGKSGQPSSAFSCRAIPPTLKDVLLARFDRLEPGAAVARMASIFGRDFSRKHLDMIANLDGTTLRQALHQLVEAEILQIHGFPPESTYRFKHVLVQEAAYRTLSNNDRKRYHRRFAGKLKESLASDDAGSEQVRHAAAVLSHHYEQAGDMDKAVLFELEAGRGAIALAGFDEAIEQLDKARRHLAALPESAERQRTELGIILALGVAHAGSGGFSGDKAGKAYARAQALCATLGDPPETAGVLSGAGSFYFMRADYAKASDVAERALQLGERTHDSIGLIIGHRIRGAVELVTGRCACARRTLDCAINLYEQHPRPTGSYALDHKTTALCYFALASMAMGEDGEAIDAATASLEHAIGIDAHSHNYALCYLAAVRHLRGDDAAIRLDVAGRSAELARSEGFATWMGMSDVLKGAALMHMGKVEEGIHAIETGIDAYQRVQAVTFEPFTRSVLAEACLATGQLERALATVHKAERVSEVTGQVWYLPELRRLHAEILLRQQQPVLAQEQFRQALELSLQLGTNGWSLRIIDAIEHFDAATPMRKPTWQSPGHQTDHARPRTVSSKCQDLNRKLDVRCRRSET